MKRAPATGVVITDFLERTDEVLADNESVRAEAMSHLPPRMQRKVQEVTAR